MTLGDLNDRLNDLTARIAGDRTRVDSLVDAVAEQRAMLTELLKRTAPRCEDSLEAVEAKLQRGCVVTESGTTVAGDDSYADAFAADWLEYHRRDCRLSLDHTGPCSPQGSPTDPSPSRDLAEHLAASPEAGNGDAPEGHLSLHESGFHCSWCDGEDDVPIVCSGIGVDLVCERCIRASWTIFRSVAYCAICDGDALPVAVRLKGGGFVCEGCVLEVAG